MKNLICVFVLLIMMLSWSCKKDDDKPSPKPKPFRADTTVVEVDDSLFLNFTHNPSSMVYHPAENAIYCYVYYNADNSGFEILKYDLSTKSLISVFVHPDAGWHNFNGSEGRRLCLYDGEIWVPGGATNLLLKRLLPGNNTMTDVATYYIGTIEFGGKNGNSPYEIAGCDESMYIVSMQDFVFYGKFATNMVTNRGHFSTSGTSHGSSLVTVVIDSITHLLVKCSKDGKIELRTTGGTFVRSVTIPVNNNSQLVRDSKQRVYYYDWAAKKFIRYSADLLTKEEFPVTNFNDWGGIAIKEDSKMVTLYGNYYRGLGMVRLPM